SRRKRPRRHACDAGARRAFRARLPEPAQPAPPARDADASQHFESFAPLPVASPRQFTVLLCTPSSSDGTILASWRRVGVFDDGTVSGPGDERLAALTMGAAFRSSPASSR